MELILIIVIAFVGLSLGFGMLVIFNRLRQIEAIKQDDQGVVLINQNIQGMQNRMDATTQAINERLDNAGRVISEVSRELGTMSQIGTQLAQFQDFLKSPKLRGSLGEQGLKDLLMQVLPVEFLRFQYGFRTGDIVDAAILLTAGIVPIDSKFPLENFNRYIKASDEAEKGSALMAFRRDFRNRITEISRKYILPDEGTVDFAMMYLPSETVYYELISNDRFRDLYDFAAVEKVIVVSPSTLFYYLRTIMVGLEGQRVNKMAHQILTAVKTIQQETYKFGDGVRLLDKHLGNAKNTMDQVTQNYSRLSQKVDMVMQIEEHTEPQALISEPDTQIYR
jgi:DNA recombination protein RmuC